MEPISALVTGYAADKLIEVAESAVKVHVIERWSRYRARQFFQAFCDALIDIGVADTEIGQKLDELLSDEKRSEIVFDAYRAVCLTKSRLLGPRVIALLTAELIITEALADESDERIFAAAEELSDAEFEDFEAFVNRQQKLTLTDAKDRPTVNKHDGSLLIQLADETTTSNWLPRDSRSVGPLDLTAHVGSWGPKLKTLGLLSDDVKERQWRFDADDERHIDEPGIAREITWWVTLEGPALRLAKLVGRARPKSEAS